ncbi:MAG TPA: FAD-dependent oxidoreductase [Acidimicrobiia bacterium]|nr:FAD-dependent oxidoreductase [Acidimicrobiia bacterium]
MTSMLLSPIDLGAVRIKNRVVSTAHGAYLDFYRPGVDPTQYVAYQERRARGGCGLIICQTMIVHPSSQTLGHWMWEHDDLVERLSMMAERVHAHGARLMVQIGHFGAQFRSDGAADLSPNWGFSPLLSPSGWEPSHEMAPDEIEEVIAGFEAAARACVEAGLDGVEIHGAHGYLVHQSFSPWGNQRDDEWGDPLKFLFTLMERLRPIVGPDRILGLRMSADDFLTESGGGLGPDGMRAVAAEACATGYLDYLNQSAGSRSAHYARAIPDYHGRPGVFLPLTKAFKATSSGVPVIGAGKIVSPAQAEAVLAAGEADLVAMTRAQIADPDLVAKYERGEADRIRPCVGTNSGCADRMEGGRHITCFHNPETGREATHADLVPAEEPREVLVVGAGPAGLKAAEVAARRGHRVTVVDRASKPGGRLRWTSKLGAAASMLDAVDWLVRELELLGVDLRFGVDVDEEYLRAATPEAVILATGSIGSGVSVPDDGSVEVLTIDGTMAADLSGKRALVVDLLGWEEQGLVAEYVADQAARTTVVTPFPQIGQNYGYTHIRRHLEHLYGAGADLRTSTVLTRLEGGTATLRHVFSRETDVIPVDVVVAGTPPDANTGLAAVAAEVAGTVILAGDAVAPRTALFAFRTGDDAGRAV